MPEPPGPACEDPGRSWKPDTCLFLLILLIDKTKGPCQIAADIVARPGFLGGRMQETPIQQRPIGIFDSGVGGLSVFKEVRKLLPFEAITYFADSGNCPYGSKTREEVLFLARKHIEFLLGQHCKLIVIACNTITAVAIDHFRSEYGIPFIGMEPALKPAALQTRTKKIGVLATENTFNGRLFKQTFEKHANGLEVFIQPGYGLVELVEKGEQDSEAARHLLERYLIPMMEKGADTLVLGCTHYPFLKDMIEKVAGTRLAVIDPSDAVAAQTKRILMEYNLMSDSRHTPRLNFFTTGEKTMAESFLSFAVSCPFRLEQIGR